MWPKIRLISLSACGATDTHREVVAQRKIAGREPQKPSTHIFVSDASIVCARLSHGRGKRCGLSFFIVDIRKRCALGHAMKMHRRRNCREKGY